MSILNFDYQKSPKGSANKKIKGALGIGALVLTASFGSTLASNISLNDGGNVEFGQGVAQTTACDDSISITPTSGFVNSNGGGSFALSAIEVTEVDSSTEHCYGKTFTIKGYGETGGALDLVSNVASVEVTDFGDSFGLVGSPEGVDIESTDGAGFALIFNSANSPVSASNLYRITIESTSIDAFIVGAQSGVLQGRAEGTATYSVTTYNVTDGTPVSIQWFESDGTTTASAPTGIFASASNISSGTSSVSVSANGAQSQGSYYFKLSIAGNLSSLNTVFVDVSAIMIGDVGAGGGRIFYINDDGFPCGTDFSNTGSPTGGLCHYLEVAPKTWSSGSSDTKYPWLSSSAYACDSLTVPTACSVSNGNVYDVTGITNIPYPNWENTLPLSQIGLGYQNSLAILNAPNTNSTTTAASAARAYTGGSKSDWYLPTVAEYNQLCKWGYGLQTSTATYDLCDYNLGSSILTGDLSSFTFNWNASYWSSSEANPVTSLKFNLTRQYAGDGSTPGSQEKGVNQRTAQGWHNFVRPIRAY